MRLAFIFFLIACSAICLFAKSPTTKSTADLVDLVRPSVVQVAVELTPLDPRSAIPSPLDQCFRGGAICVVGTGFLVNSTGDVVTASHVANGIQGNAQALGVQQIIQMLEANGIHAEPRIAVSIPNVETSHLTVASASQLFPATLVAADAEHDIAVFHATVNPFTDMPKTFGGSGTAGLSQAKARFVHLALKRPRDGEEIFACGFPFGESGLVTTSGAIASAWKSETLSTAKATVRPLPVDIYQVDLRLNPGNSGGPVFRMQDQAVLGMAVELKGNLGIVVPAKYIAEFLKAHGIQWSSAANIH